MSSGVWYRTMFCFSATYSSHENWSRWFGVMFSIAAMCGLRSVSWSCVWLISSTVHVRSSMPSSSPSSPVPMLPPTRYGRPSAASIAATRLVVVVLPLLPVMPIVGPGQCSRK